MNSKLFCVVKRGDKGNDSERKKKCVNVLTAFNCLQSDE